MVVDGRELSPENGTYPQIGGEQWGEVSAGGRYDASADGRYVLAELTVVRKASRYLLVAVHDGGVVSSPQFVANLREGYLAVLTEQIHRYLSGE